jgi:hypothetical protein
MTTVAGVIRKTLLGYVKEGLYIVPTPTLSASGRPCINSAGMDRW